MPSETDRTCGMMKRNSAPSSPPLSLYSRLDSLADFKRFAGHRQSLSQITKMTMPCGKSCRSQLRILETMLDRLWNLATNSAARSTLRDFAYGSSQLAAVRILKSRKGRCKESLEKATNIPVQEGLGFVGKLVFS